MKKRISIALILLLTMITVGAQAAQYGAMVKNGVKTYSEKGEEGGQEAKENAQRNAEHGNAKTHPSRGKALHASKAKHKRT